MREAGSDARWPFGPGLSCSLSVIEDEKFYDVNEYIPNFQNFGLLTNKKFAVKLKNNDIITDVIYEGYGEFSKQGKLLLNIKEFKLYDTNKL